MRDVAIIDTSVMVIAGTVALQFMDGPLLIISSIVLFLTAFFLLTYVFFSGELYEEYNDFVNHKTK